MRTILWVIASLIASIGMSQTSCAAQAPPTPRSVAFVGVNLLAMSDDRIVENTTVLIQDGVVVAIDPQAKRA